MGLDQDDASGMGWSPSLTEGIVGGGSENRVRRRALTVSSLSSAELMPGVLEALSIATVSSASSGGGEKDQTWIVD